MFKFLTLFEKFWTLNFKFVHFSTRGGKFQKLYKRALWPYNARALTNQIARYIALIL